MNLSEVLKSIDSIESAEKQREATKEISESCIIAFKELLEFSIKEKNNDYLSITLNFGYNNNLFGEISRAESKELREWLSKLLGSIIEETWQFEHENLILILQDLYNIELVKPLHKAVFTKPPYLYEVDDADALSRKAIWALGKLVLPVIDIPVDEEASRAAIEVLKELSESDDPVVAERAKRQFDRFAENGIILE